MPPRVEGEESPPLVFDDVFPLTPDGENCLVGWVCRDLAKSLKKERAEQPNPGCHASPDEVSQNPDHPPYQGGDEEGCEEKIEFFKYT